jgi:tryptophanyl-tRNA synthetase
MDEMDPWAADDIGDYDRLKSKFGMGSFEKHKSRFRDFRYIRRDIIFGHRDFDRIIQAQGKGESFAMMTGLMPSGRFHLGHKMVADEIIWFQNMGAQTFVCAADTESYLMRDISFRKARETALTEYLANYFALGLSDRDLVFWLQSDHIRQYYRLRDMASKRVTLNELSAIYGQLSPAKIISVLTQAADILHPQLPEYGGPKPVVVPVGADQDPHIRLARDIAQRLNAPRQDGPDFQCIPPSATYHKFMSALTGGKMSSSDPKTHIALNESPAEAKKKIMSAKTGGKPTVEEQKKTGGDPEKCVIFELYKYHLIDDDCELARIEGECKSGKLLCGQDKQRCAQLLVEFLEKHQEKMPEALDRARQIVER